LESEEKEFIKVSTIPYHFKLSISH
jgi:hypothetical protein